MALTREHRRDILRAAVFLCSDALGDAAHQFRLGRAQRG